MSPVTFRHPSVLAKIVTTVDAISDGRVEVGVGAGWYELEHRRFGLPMPPIDVRFEILEDTLAILTTLWGPDGGTFSGRHWSVSDVAMQPKPVQQPHPPIILGGKARPRSVALAARYADEYNLLGLPSDLLSPRVDAVREGCVREGRDPNTITVSAMVPTVAASGARDLQRRIDEAVLEARVSPRLDTVKRGHDTWLVGTIYEVAAGIRRYRAAGVQRLVFQLMAGSDLGLIDSIAEACRRVDE